MAKKKVSTVQGTAKKPTRKGIAVRLDLRPDAVEELDRIAETKGLNRASMARMAVMEWLESRRGQK